MKQGTTITPEHLIFLLLTALPLALGIGYALAYSLGLTGALAEGLTGKHWAQVLGSPVTWRSLGFSFYVAVVSIGLAVVAAMVLVIHWHRDLERGWLSFLIYWPLTLPAMVVAFFIFQVLSKAGFLSRLAYQLGWTAGINDFPDLVNDAYGIGLIAAHGLMALPFFMILYANLYRAGGLPDLSQTAATLGAAPRQVVWRVVVPVLLRQSFTTVVLYVLFVMSSYEIPLLLGSQSREMITVLAIRKLQRFNLLDIPQAYALSVLYSGLVLLLVLWLLGKKRGNSEIWL